jgi:hypothetical protein
MTTVNADRKFESATAIQEANRSRISIHVDRVRPEVTWKLLHVLKLVHWRLAYVAYTVLGRPTRTPPSNR